MTKHYTIKLLNQGFEVAFDSDQELLDFRNKYEILESDFPTGSSDSGSVCIYFNYGQAPKCMQFVMIDETEL